MTAGRRSHLPMLAGWLFADLFLLLLITGLAALPARSVDQPQPSPSVSGRPSPTPTRTPPPGLDPKYVDFTIPLSPDAYRAGRVDELVRLVENRLNRLDPRHRRVGFVLVFASDSRDNIARAQATATDVVELLRRRSRAFASSAGLGYWNGDRDNFQFKVFLMN